MYAGFQILKMRRAFATIASAVASASSCRIAASFFTGTPDDARELLELGFSFTFGGVVTFARDYDDAIRLIPLDRILSETDAPYLAPVPKRGKTNEPAFVVHTAAKVAELKGVSVAELEAATTENFFRLFAKAERASCG